MLHIHSWVGTVCNDGGLFPIVLIAIGVYAYNKSTSNLNEYMLGGRNIGAWVTALSAGASDMSG